MSKAAYFDINPTLDLVLEREIDVPQELVWRAWTQPEHVKQWFAPTPWTVSECKIDLQPGGQFYTVMRSPEGQAFPSAGCFLEIVPTRSLCSPTPSLRATGPANGPFSRLS